MPATGCDVREALDGRVEHELRGDLSDFAYVQDVLAKTRPEFVMHLAARVPPAADEALWTANVGVTANLLEALRQTGPPYPRVLLVGSAAEYGPSGTTCIAEDHPTKPTTTYGRAKLIQTLLGQSYAREWGLPVIVVRPFNVVGPGMGENTVVGTICAQLTRGDELSLGNLDSARDFLDIRDAVAAYWLAVQQGDAGDVFNVCSGQTTRIRDVVSLATEGRDVKLASDVGRLRAGDFDYSCGNADKLMARTGWRPTIDLAISLRDTVAHLDHSASSVSAQ